MFRQNETDEVCVCVSRVPWPIPTCVAWRMRYDSSSVTDKSHLQLTNLCWKFETPPPPFSARSHTYDATNSSPAVLHIHLTRTNAGFLAKVWRRTLDKQNSERPPWTETSFHLQWLRGRSCHTWEHVMSHIIRMSRVSHTTAECVMPCMFRMRHVTRVLSNVTWRIPVRDSTICVCSHMWHYLFFPHGNTRHEPLEKNTPESDLNRKILSISGL